MIGDTGHTSLLVENRCLFSLQGGTFLRWLATGYSSLRNSWEGDEVRKVFLTRFCEMNLVACPSYCPLDAVAPELSRLIDSHRVLVFPMDINELRSAIEQPAALSDVQLAFEGTLVSDLLYEIRGQPGALPLLQFTLERCICSYF